MEEEKGAFDLNATEDIRSQEDVAVGIFRGGCDFALFEVGYVLLIKFTQVALHT